ncbi:MAG: hypothetical protein CMH31_06855 [Micavibrio sp.]|nr:hypothetical protein [Micavibrio sp.]
MGFVLRATEFLDEIEKDLSAPDCGTDFCLSASAATLLDRILMRNVTGAIHDDEEVVNYTIPANTLRQLIDDGKKNLPIFRRQEFQVIP